jgi:hypothetical protein
MEKRVLWEVDSHSAVNKFPAINGTQIFISVFSTVPATKAYPEPDESSPHPYTPSYPISFIATTTTAFKDPSIHPSMPTSPSHLFPSGFPTKMSVCISQLYNFI